jgi:hypothetical protein
MDPAYFSDVSTTCRRTVCSLVCTQVESGHLALILRSGQSDRLYFQTTVIVQNVMTIR